MTDLPQPLAPADCDLRDFPFMPLDVVRLRDSDIAAISNGDEFRCAVLLWCASWHQVPAGSLPDDDIVLSQYAGFGRVVKEWKKVRNGSMRGWIKCADGRLYHPVVAEKAAEAWAGRLKYREEKEKERIRKAELRAAKKAEEDAAKEAISRAKQKTVPDLSGGQEGIVRETTPECPPDFALIGTVDSGEGQWTVDSGQLTSKEGDDDATDSSREDDDRLPPRPQHGAAVTPTNRATEIATKLRAAGITKVTAFNPDVAVTWAQDERVTDQLLADAVALAKEAKGDAPIPVGYLKPIIAELLNPPEAKPAKARDDWEWMKSDSGIQRKANELGIRAHGNMSYRDLADKCRAEIQKRKGAAR